MHFNFIFFGMTAMPTFVCFVVIKNADIDTDLARFKAHISTHF
jgi:modulator of drug activity B